MLWSLDTYVLWDVLDFCRPPPCGQIVDNWLSTCMHGHQSHLSMASLASTSMKRIQNTCFENERLDWQHILPHCLEGKTTDNWSLGVLIPVNNEHEIAPPRQLPCFGNVPINWVFPQSANSQQKDHHILAVVLESLMISLSNGTKLYRARAPKGHRHSTFFSLAFLRADLSGCGARRVLAPSPATLQLAQTFAHTGCHCPELFGEPGASGFHILRQLKYTSPMGGLRNCSPFTRHQVPPNSVFGLIHFQGAIFRFGRISLKLHSTSCQFSDTPNPS